MKQMKAQFVQIGAARALFSKTVYVFNVNGKGMRFNFNRFLCGTTPDMNTEGTLTLDDNDEFVSFDYDGGYLALEKRKMKLPEIPKE